MPWAAASRAISRFVCANHTQPSSERRADGAVLVRVPSRVMDGRALPDAVFAFRSGDPQYSFWDSQLRGREVLAPPATAMPIMDMDPSVG